MPLTDTQIRALLPANKPYKKADGRGLYLEVRPNGSRLWRLKFRYAGKEKRISLGAYPIVSLAEARKKREQKKALLEKGIDPAAERRKRKISARISNANTFEAVGAEYIRKMECDGRAETTLSKARWFLRLLSPTLGTLPVAEIEPQVLLEALRKQERRGKYETAKKCRSFASRVFRYAVQTGRAQTDPADLLRGALVSPKVEHYSAILDPRKLGSLLRAIEDYSCYPGTKLALLIAPHVFLRPGELRQAKWEEVKLESKVWEVPAERMKARRSHRFPLSDQVVNWLSLAQESGNSGGYIFPAFHSNRRPLSENSLNAAFRRMGFGKSEITAHGLRSTASTLLNESNLWNPDAIERALAHADRDQVRAAYHRGEHWEERVKMAQWWSDYLETLKAGDAKYTQADS